MCEIKQINIENRTYYFYNDQITLNYFDAKLLKVDKKYYNEIDIYYIAYVTVKKIYNCKNIKSVNLLYLMIDEMIDHLKEKNQNKYLVLDDLDENKEVLKNYSEGWKGVKKGIETIMVAKRLNMGKITWKLGSNLMMICH